MNNTAFDLVFPAVGKREIVARDDGGDITSDAGLLLVSLADRKLGLTQVIAQAILDRRDQSKVDHHVLEMIRERIYAICQDYEDANDLMHEPVHEIGQWLRSVLRGHYQYYGVPCNIEQMQSFYYQVIWLWRRTLMRRSQKGRTSWEQMDRRIKRWLPQPTILRLYPEQRLRVRT